jgi:hypothetical protein
MLLFSINRSRGYENPSLEIIAIELCSTGGFPLEEAREHCFQIQSVISVVILISFQCYCGECSGYIVVILPLLAFYFYFAYILYLVYYIHSTLNILTIIFCVAFYFYQIDSFKITKQEIKKTFRTETQVLPWFTPPGLRPPRFGFLLSFISLHQVYSVLNITYEAKKITPSSTACNLTLDYNAYH